MGHDGNVRLTCYRIRRAIGGEAVRDFDDIVDLEDRSVLAHPLFTGNGFTAHLYTTTTPAHEPGWASFVRPAMAAGTSALRVSSASGLLIVRRDVRRRPMFYAFAFGPAARYLLRDGAYERAFGLRAALNLDVGGSDRSALRAVELKRHGSETVRSRQQANRATAISSFGVDRLRDILTAAVGPPVDQQTWGRWIEGRDGLTIDSGRAPWSCGRWM